MSIIIEWVLMGIGSRTGFPGLLRIAPPYWQCYPKPAPNNLVAGGKIYGVKSPNFGTECNIFKEICVFEKLWN